ICEEPNLTIEPWGDRHIERQSHPWLEIIAATWRILAIRRPADDHGLQEEIANDVHDYLQNVIFVRDENRVQAMSGLRNVVGEVLHQWRNKQLDSSVIVNTSKQMPRF